jgi:hypothetical protein
VTDDDITRKRLAKHDAQLVHLLGVDGQPGRVANLEDDMKAGFAAVHAEQRAMRQELKATNVEVAGLKLFNTKVIQTIAVCTFFGAAIAVGIGWLIAYLK